MTIKWKQVGILAAILILGYMPFMYGSLTWWPHNRWVGILSGPVAIIASAALTGAAAGRLSKWWLLALFAPLSGIILLLTASV